MVIWPILMAFIVLPFLFGIFPAGIFFFIDLRTPSSAKPWWSTNGVHDSSLKNEKEKSFFRTLI